MISDEIIAGLRTALDRGFSLEESIQSFINAGYNPQEVRDAASSLSRGIPALPTVMKEEAKTVEERKKSATEVKKGTSNKVLWIILILVSLIVIAIAISLLLFKDKFLSVIDALFP